MNRLRIKRKIAKTYCSVLPPLASQRFRNIIYTEQDGLDEAAIFKRKSITGSYFTGNTKDLHAYVFAVHGFYDWRNVAILRKLCSSGDEIVEVGANVGTETVCFSDIVKERGNVYAFEPVETNLFWSKKNAELTKHRNITIFPVASSDKDGFVDFIPPPNQHMSGIGSIKSYAVTHQNLISVKCRKLDNYIDKFRNIKCIYVDVEGADLFVIRGAKSTIKKFRPILIFEYSPKLMKNFRLGGKDVYDEINKLNYQCFKIGKLFLQKFNFKDKTKSNLVCIPEEKLNYKNKISKAVLLSALFPPYFFDTKF